MKQTLTIVVHGESGAGKSYLADTAPGPRLVFDAEGGVRFTPSRKVHWNPKDKPPEPDGSWDTAVVTVTDLDSLRYALQWLQVGQHPFKSIVIDSLTEVQKRFVDSIAGAEQMKLQDYGELSRKSESLVRQFRDLTMHQTHPVEVVVFVCGTRERGQEHAVLRPALTGSMAEQLGYYVDVMTYLAVIPSGEDGKLQRRALFAQVDGIAAKDRTGRLGVTMDAPSVPKMLEEVYGNEEA